ncbi:hypothetical protein [Sphingobium sp. WCS2017Hpa-17]|uniref:hypothetical protein n=1 Tax=Sphingobium sp. WCS2017Hpa-17 TaxID=3073638 RepID=UPI00288C2ED9|nr:hypothetical protein [Sphingobium sp. WCS2017Hpa-17]
MLRRLGLVVSLLSLSACWSGLPFFTPADAVPTIPDGLYRMAETDAGATEGETIRISRQPDNSLRVEGGDHPMRALTVPLDSSRPDLFILQLQKLNPADADRAPKAMYMLLDMTGHTPRIGILPCDGETGALVTRQGGSVARDPQSAASCTFPSRALLHQQMRAVAGHPLHDRIILMKVSD